MFNSAVGEVLKCVDCGVAVGGRQTHGENYVHMLKYGSSNKALTVQQLVLENVVAAPIDGYRATEHNEKNTQNACRNSGGAYNVRYFVQELPVYLCLSISSRSLSGSCSDEEECAHPLQKMRRHDAGAQVGDQELRKFMRTHFGGVAKNSRYFAPESIAHFPELNTKTPKDSRDTKTVAYALYATIVHEGRSTNHGHYTAYVLNAGHWYHVDDCTVHKVDTHVALDPPQTIYTLFYHRDEHGPKSSEGDVHAR
jgi:hypothetical protein